MGRIKWSNIPIPEGHVALLVVGIALQIWRPLEIFTQGWMRHAIGWPLLVTGILLTAWCVRAVNAIDIAKPGTLITTGPYAFSRNPMYLAWTMIYLAGAVLVNTWWLMILLPALALFTHYFVVKREEAQLERLFGERYRDYCARVRRYM